MGLRGTSKASDAKVGSYKPLNLLEVYGAHRVSGALRAHMMGTPCTVGPFVTLTETCSPPGGPLILFICYGLFLLYGRRFGKCVRGAYTYVAYVPQEAIQGTYSLIEGSPDPKGGPYLGSL